MIDLGSDLRGLDSARLIAAYRSARSDDSYAVLEGFHSIKHAMRFKATLIDCRCVDQSGIRSICGELAPDIETQLLSISHPTEPDIFRQLAPHPHQTGMIAIARRPAQGLIKAAPVLLLDEPSHLGNLGAVIRVAAGLGAAGVAVTGDLDPWHPTVVRASAGLHFALPVGRWREIGGQCAQRPVICIDPQGTPLTHASLSADMPRDAVLVFGNERRGVSHVWLTRADRRLSISMREGVSSLNLATSAAIVLHHFSLRHDLPAMA